MAGRQKYIILLVMLISLLLMINYSFVDNALEKFLLEKETAEITRVIDGDTVVTGNISIRLLGINTPERGEKYYSEAKEFLEKQILNHEVELESGKEKYDRYHRRLAYIFLENKNINKKLIENGFANYYFPSGKDNHYSEFRETWENCIEKEINLCEKSENKCAECIKLKKFDYKNQLVILENACDFNCNLTNWKIKDEGRKNFIFPEFILKEKKDIEVIIAKEKKENTNEKLFWNVKTYVWTKSGDTLFLRDEENKLVLWEGY